jgi:pectate lyase C
VAAGGAVSGVGGAQGTSVGQGGASVAKGGSSSTATGGKTGAIAGASAAGGNDGAEGGEGGGGGESVAGGASSKGGTTAKGGSTSKGGATSAGGATAKGGTSAKGGSTAKGGTMSAGGTTSVGGTTSAGGTTGNSNTVGPTKTCGCLTSSGNYSGNPLTATIVVESGEVYDGECKTYSSKSLSSGGLGDGSQEENQKPLFRVNAGGTLKNVILGAPAADGIHFYGNATVQNVHWLDIGEDAATIKADATVTIDCGSAKSGSDKIFQVNAKATWNISNFTASSAGKFMRENGGQCYPVVANIDHCDISNMDETIFRTDCTSSKVTISNTRYSAIKDALAIVKSTKYNTSGGNVTITNVQKY